MNFQLDPRMLQMMGSGIGTTDYGLPQKIGTTQPMQSNLGLPSMAQPQQFQQSPLVANFGQNMLGLQGQQFQQPQRQWMGQGGNFQNIGMALMQSGLL